MGNPFLICGRPPTFGDIEQIKLVKKERARLRELDKARESGENIPDSAYEKLTLCYRVWGKITRLIDEEEDITENEDDNNMWGIEEDVEEDIIVEARSEEEAEEKAKDMWFEDANIDDVEIINVEEIK
jgi:hypothetical protein